MTLAEFASNQTWSLWVLHKWPLHSVLRPPGSWGIMLRATANDHEPCHSLVINFLHSASCSSNLRPLLSYLSFLYSYISHQGTWQLKIPFIALQDQVHYPRPLFALLCHGAHFYSTVATLCWYKAPCDWSFWRIINKKSNPSPLCGPESQISTLSVSTFIPKYISKLLWAPKTVLVSWVAETSLRLVSSILSTQLLMVNCYFHTTTFSSWYVKGIFNFIKAWILKLLSHNELKELWFETQKWTMVHFFQVLSFLKQ